MIGFFGRPSAGTANRRLRPPTAGCGGVDRVRIRALTNPDSHARRQAQSAESSPTLRAATWTLTLTWTLTATWT